MEAMPGLVWRLKPLGTQGVQVFFCISGFVICRGLMSEYARRGAVSLSAFYRRRFFRIFPALSLYLGFVALLSWADIVQVDSWQFVQSIIFSCNFVNCGWLLGHTWSLAYEEQFYIVFPLIFVGLMKIRARKKLLIFTVTLAVLSIPIHVISPATAKYISMFGYMLSGCISALYWNELQSWLARLPLWLWVTACAFIPLLNFFVFPPIVFHFIVTLILPPIMCAVVFGTPVWHPIIARFFLNKSIIYLGRISFTIYLWQQLATKDYGFASPLTAFWLLLAIVGFAHLSFVYFEQPLINVGAQKSADPLVADRSAKPVRRA